jgi:hypothetical protein
VSSENGYISWLDCTFQMWFAWMLYMTRELVSTQHIEITSEFCVRSHVSRRIDLLSSIFFGGSNTHHQHVPSYNANRLDSL